MRQVLEALRRFRALGLPWPLAPDADEVIVAARLFTDHTRTAGARPMPDWSTIHAELKRKGVTLQLLWIEYKQREPDGYPYVLSALSRVGRDAGAGIAPDPYRESAIFARDVFPF